MRFWELGNKDVINCKNGHRLGCVGDLEIDVCKMCIRDRWNAERESDRYYQQVI